VRSPGDGASTGGAFGTPNETPNETLTKPSFGVPSCSAGAAEPDETPEGYLAHKKQRPTPASSFGVPSGSTGASTPAFGTPASADGENIFIEHMTSDRKLKASREGSK